MNWMCPRRIGFLFPHACDRISPVGCPYCDNGQVEDPYAQRNDRGAYTEDYERDSSDASMVGAGSHEAMDFTEADGETLLRRRREFEDDMTES
jgi:hypothetical protein